jgi:hypothetical protein
VEGLLRGPDRERTLPHALAHVLDDQRRHGMFGAQIEFTGRPVWCDPMVPPDGIAVVLLWKERS